MRRVGYAAPASAAWESTPDMLRACFNAARIVVSLLWKNATSSFISSPSAFLAATSRAWSSCQQLRPIFQGRFLNRSSLPARAYGVEVDAKGNVYVAGRAGPGFPVTAGAFQTEYGGSRYNEFYGSQNGFVAKLSPDGGRLIWASYVGVGELCRDLDADGDIYLPLDTEGNAYVAMGTASPDFPSRPAPSATAPARVTSPSSSSRRRVRYCAVRW